MTLKTQFQFHSLSLHPGLRSLVVVDAAVAVVVAVVAVVAAVAAVVVYVLSDLQMFFLVA